MDIFGAYLGIGGILGFVLPLCWAADIRNLAENYYSINTAGHIFIFMIGLPGFILWGFMLGMVWLFDFMFDFLFKPKEQ